MSEAACQAQRVADAASCHAVRSLRDRGYSLADIGYALGLSRARISQLVKA